MFFKNKKGPPSPEEKISSFDILGKLSYWWLDNFIFSFGNSKKEMTYDHIYRRSEKDTTKYNFQKLEAGEKLFLSEKDIAEGNYKLYTILLYNYSFQIFIMFLLNLVEITFNFATPFVIEQFILYIEDTNPEKTYHMGILWSILLLICPVVRSIADNYYYFITYRIFLNVESAISAKVFRKVLKLDSISRSTTKSGELVNFMSIDAYRIGEFFSWINFAFSAPVTVIIAAVLIVRLVGWVGLIGLSTAFVAIPISLYLAKRFSDAGEKMMNHKDERVKIINEMLLGIRVVKFFTWESEFKQKIDQVRNDECSELKNAGMFDSMNVVILRLIPISGSVLTFLSFVFFGGKLEIAKVFSVVTLFNIINIPLYNSAYFMTQFVSALVSARRLSKFFGLSESTNYSQNTSQKEVEIIEEFKKKPSKTLRINEEETEKLPLIPKEEEIKNKGKINLSTGEIFIEDGYFTYDKRELILKNINIHIQPGQLVCVIGQVGSGKSSLLNAIFDNLIKLKGNISVNGKLAYCSQSPWMVNATVKENILFGNEYDEKFYNEVISASALTPDFKQLPNGDETEIGENGINVSGGQKHRVSLARACYSESDIYLLDSPLAAVDVHVGKKLFNDCICNFLIEKRKKTVVLVTHSLQFLNSADLIIMMENGRIKAQGTFDELKKIDENFEKLMNETEEEEVTKKRKESIAEKKNEKEKGSLTENEEKLEGNLSLRVIWRYFSGYGFYFIICCIATLLAKFSLLGAGAWLSVWADKKINLSDRNFMIVYALLNLSNIGNVFFQRIGFIFGGIRSSIKLHTKMLYSVLRSPMSFFDTTPTGRILNRFSEDQTRVDSLLNFNFSFLFEYAAELIGIMILISIISPPTLIIIIPVCVIYFFIQKYFRKPYREVKRFVEMSRSPLFNHFAASISGTSTIKAYNLENEFILENEQRIDFHQRSRWIEYVMSRWISLRLELLGCLIVFGTSIAGVLLTNYLDPSLVAYAVTYSLTISENFNWGVRYFILAESGLINVERIDGYSYLEEERKSIEKVRPPKNWPSKGELVFENLQMRYREGLDLVLKGLNFKIGANEKIGIVGRTGSGKSSLLLVLFRMVELSGGKLIIDGIDVSTIGLFDLRRNLSIIPQDPTVFSGRLRDNIDPFSKYTDQQIWDALESCHLKQTVDSYPSQLYETIDEAGSNLSVGERQLLCLCRAILENQKIVVLDEATANVDHESDMVIQETIRDKFKDKTVITIAHRLDTIMDVDKVLVMNAGRILEYDSPLNLINNENSDFSKMVYETGDYSKILIEMAQEAEKLKKEKNQ